MWTAVNSIRAILVWLEEWVRVWEKQPATTTWERFLRMPVVESFPAPIIAERLTMMRAWEPCLAKTIRGRFWRELAREIIPAPTIKEPLPPWDARMPIRVRIVRLGPHAQPQPAS